MIQTASRNAKCCFRREKYASEAKVLTDHPSLCLSDKYHNLCACSWMRYLVSCQVPLSLEHPGPFKLFNSGKTVLMWDVLKSKTFVRTLACEFCVYRGHEGNCLFSFSRCFLELGPVLPPCCLDFSVCSSLKMLALWWGRVNFVMGLQGL